MCMIQIIKLICFISFFIHFFLISFDIDRSGRIEFTEFLIAISVSTQVYF
jgi:hypothetical protein